MRCDRSVVMDCWRRCIALRIGDVMCVRMVLASWSYVLVMCVGDVIAQWMEVCVGVCWEWS